MGTATSVESVESPGVSVWETILWLGASALISYSVIGLALAAAGWFHPVPVIGGSLVLTVAVFVWVRPRIISDPPSVRPHWLLTAAVLVLAAGSGIWNGAHHGEHLIAERDPGVYAATGLWLAHEGNLRVAPPQGPFAGNPSVHQSTIGFSPNSAGSLDAQFPHLNAVFLAGGAWFGSVRIFLVPAFLMSCALVMVYALGCRLGHPFGGAFGALALAVSFPFIYVARDTYSEPVALLLLLTGLWALTFVRRGGIRPAVVAGALLGAICMARIDGLVSLIPVAGILAMEVAIAKRKHVRARALGYGGAYVAMAGCATAGTLEVRAFSFSYYTTNLGPRIGALIGGIVLATVAGALIGLFGFRTEGERESPHRLLRWAFAPFAVGVIAFLAWCAYIRPDFAGLRAAMATKATTTALSPWANTLSYLWLEWYLGPLLVAGSFAALLWMTWQGLIRPDRMWLPTAGVGLAATLLYLYTPSITPDHPWAMRRFVVVSIPILLLAAGCALAAIARLHRPATVVLSTVLGLAALFAPARFSHRLAATSVGASLAHRFDAICAIAHQQPSAILVTPDRSLGYTIPETLGNWCEVPVAGATSGIDAQQVMDLDRKWAEQGRRLLLVATSPLGIKGATGVVTDIPGEILKAPEDTVDRPPTRIAPDARVAQSADGDLPLFVIDVNHIEEPAS